VLEDRIAAALAVRHEINEAGGVTETGGVAKDELDTDGGGLS